MSCIKDYIRDFEYFLHIEKNYSKKTIATYRVGLNDFLNFLESQDSIKSYELNEIKKENIKNYIVYLKNNIKNKPRTINLKISTLKSFYKFLIEKGIIGIADNPTLELHQQKLPKTLPLYLTYEEAENLLLGTKLLSKNACRDYALLCLFLMTGARLSEVTGLTLDQINFMDKSITFYGKGSKERTVPLVERAEASLKEYLNNEKYYITRYGKKKAQVIEDKTLRGREPKVNTNTVFLNRYGCPLTERGIQDIINKLMLQTGIYRKGLSVHKLRHTCFTLLHRSGVDILTIKKIAGHDNIKTTEIYTHINDKDLFINMQRNPLNSNNYDNSFIKKIKESYFKR
jgi:Site-specific recombinase XerD